MPAADAGGFFMTSQGKQHSSLSAYTPDEASAEDGDKMRAPKMKDDVDVLIGVCDWWQSKHGVTQPTCADSGITLDEVRFQQLKEVENIKRVFAKRNCPVNVALLERALVMPSHRIQAKDPADMFNTVPNLTRNPFLEAKTSGKKKKGKTKAKAKDGGEAKKSRSSDAEGNPKPKAKPSNKKG